MEYDFVRRFAKLARTGSNEMDKRSPLFRQGLLALLGVSGLNALFLASSSAMASGCHLNPLAISNSSATSENVTVAFGEADDATHPSAWQGPLKISIGSGPACTVSDEVAIVEQPVLLGRGVLYVATYSGSENRVYAVDAKTCKVVWNSPVFDETASYKSGTLFIGTQPVLLDGACKPTSKHGK